MTSGIAGFMPTKIMPLAFGNPHESCCGLSTSHDCGTDSRALSYGTGDQPAGVLDTSVSGPTACRMLLIRATDVKRTGPLTRVTRVRC